VGLVSDGTAGGGSKGNGQDLKRRGPIPGAPGQPCSLRSAPSPPAFTTDSKTPLNGAPRRGRMSVSGRSGAAGCAGYSQGLSAPLGQLRLAADWVRVPRRVPRPALELRAGETPLRLPAVLSRAARRGLRTSGVAMMEKRRVRQQEVDRVIGRWGARSAGWELQERVRRCFADPCSPSSGSGRVVRRVTTSGRMGTVFFPRDQPERFHLRRKWPRSAWCPPRRPGSGLAPNAVARKCLSNGINGSNAIGRTGSETL